MKLSAPLIICLLLAAPATGAPDSLPGRRATARASGGQAPGKKVESAPRAEADPLAAQRRATAAALLASLADEARSFRDGALRARAQARAADALWEMDPELSRALFRRAWADADAADREIDRKREEERKAQLAASGVSMQGDAPALRAEVLRLAGRRDRALGEEFLSQLAQATDDAEPDATASPDGLTFAEGQGLSLALKLLEEGDMPRAVQFATPALGRVTVQSLKFLSALREKDAPAADKLFASLLARASADPDADANTVSLLSSYVFTPFLYFTAYKTAGTGMSMARPDMPAPDVAPALRASFMRAAAQILLRPTTPQEYDRTSAGRPGSYLVIRRLLPLFERHAPDLTAALNARAALLLSDAPERLRSPAMDRTLGKGILPEEPTTRDEIGEALERAARTPGVAERDDIYAAAAVGAAWRGDPRAQEIAGRIVDSDLLRRVRAFSDFSFVSTAIEKKDVEAALARARKGDLTPLQRAWALERAADLTAQTDRADALALLDEAATEARRIADDDAARARALVAVATRYEKLDRGRAWDLMYEAVKAANSAPAFTGEDGEMSVQFRNKRGGWMTSFDVDEFNLAGVLSALAEEDMSRAVQLADGFTNEAARVSAVVAVARSVMAKGN